MCGKLEKAMSGTRDAVQNWDREYESAFLNIGFQQGKSSPCLFYHPYRNLRVVVHGDDFTIMGIDSNLKCITAELQKAYELKVRATLGLEPQCDKSVRILKRIVSWNEQGIQYEPDHRHVKIVIKSLEGPAATLYRSLTMRLSYLAQDRPDIQFSCKELAKGMSSPTG